MKREEEIRKRAEYIANGIMIDVQANKYNTNVYDYEKECYKHSHLMDAAIAAVNWADQHPRKGLVDTEKACKKLEKCMYDNLMFQGRLHRKEVIETFIEDFKEYLEEEICG